MTIPSVVQGTVEIEGKVFELDSPKGSKWLESVSSFRYEPTGANKPYTVRQETKKGGDYWYGYRKVAGKLHKRYIGRTAELSVSKLEEIAEALNTLQQSRVTEKVREVTQLDGQRVTDIVTDTATCNHVDDRLTALESQVQVLQESLEALRVELLGKSQTGSSSELPNSLHEVTEQQLPIELGNSQADETFTTLGVEYVEFLKEENENWKRLLAKKSPLIPSDLYTEIEKLKERNRQLCLKIGEERRSSIERISELEHQTENMLRRNQEKQARVDELEIQLETVQAEHEKLKASQPVAEWEPLEASDLLNRLKAKRKKATASLADIEALLEMMGS